jgi:hypothetical protein
MIMTVNGTPKEEISRETAIGLLQLGQRGEGIHAEDFTVSGLLENAQNSLKPTLEEKLASVGTSREKLSQSSAFQTVSLQRLHKDEGGVSGELEIVCHLHLSELEHLAGMSLEKAKRRLPVTERFCDGMGASRL